MDGTSDSETNDGVTNDGVTNDGVTNDGVTRVSLIILGAGGDLTERLLLPGLASLLAVEDCEVELIGSGRNERTAAQWAELVDGAFGAGVPEHARSRLVSTTFVTGDATDPEVLRALLAECSFTPVVYFALPPGVTTKACEALREVDLPAGTRLALEKPFGVDLESARELNGLLRDLVPENQVFRIDHFLGKSMVLNIIGLRFANRIVEAVWDAEHIERVEIVYDESLGLEGRGGYYDGAGALIDMIQSHLLQVLALVAMEPPRRVDEAELRSRVAQVLRSTRVWDDDVVEHSWRARYTAGRIGERDLPSYADESGVDPTRETETLAQLTCEIDTPRWRDVPFVLRSGKAVDQPRTEVRVCLKPTRELPGLAGVSQADVVVLDLDDGTVELRLTMNGSGDPFALEQGRLVAQVEPGPLRAYGEVLRALLAGDPILSVRDDVVEECWRIVAPVVQAWRSGSVPLEEYAAGSTGPSGWDPGGLAL